MQEVTLSHKLESMLLYGQFNDKGVF